MVNIFLELEKLKGILRGRGLDDDTIIAILSKAEKEINLSLRERLDDAMDQAIASGVDKQSPDFINELRPRQDAFMLDTISGHTDFTEPPMPMLDRLLARGAKPLKDGSGVYKIVPVGKPGNKIKGPVYANIFDAQKAISAERYESAQAQYKKIAPKDSKVKFRTVTSKQNRATQWVMPEKPKDFTAELSDINSQLRNDYDDVVLKVIRSYEEGF